VLLYLLLLAILAVLGYLLYRVIEYNKALSASGGHALGVRAGVGVGKHGSKDGKNDTGGRIGVEYHHNGEKRDMYERFENSIADELGDDYDGREGRRNEDRERRRAMMMETYAEKAKKGAIVYFHMDGCGHCRRFDPTWKEFKADHEAALKDKGISLESYDARDEYTQEMGIVGFPSVLFVDDTGKKVDTFQGTRTVAELLRFARKHGAK